VPATTPWYQGTQVPLTWTSTDTQGNPREAASATVTVTAPDLTTSTPSVTHAGSGVYTATYTTAQAGHHVVAWAAADSGYSDAFADSFEVQAAADPTIVSLAEAKEILHLTSTTEFDSIIQGYNAAATNWIEYVCGPVVQQTITEQLPIHGTEQVLTQPPVIALVPWTSVPADLAALGITLPSPASPMIRTKVYGIEYPATQLEVDAERGIVTHTSGLPFYYCAYRWQYTAGRPIIPAGIYEAAKIVLEHLFMVERGGAETSMTAGEDETTVTGYGFAVPNRAMALLAPYTAASRMVAA
jgi:hypothetical protein